MDKKLLAALEAAGPLTKTELPKKPMRGYTNTALFHRERLLAERLERENARPGERVLPTQRMSFVEAAFEVVPGRLNPNQMQELLELNREDGEKWSASALAERFGVSQTLVENMLTVNRMPRLTGDPMTSDERVYGYWD